MIKVGDLVQSPDDGCVGVVLEKSLSQSLYRIRWADGLEKWHWQETLEVIA